MYKTMMELSMKKWKLYVAIVIAAGAGIFSCTKPVETVATYTVSVSGNMERVNRSILDSVIIFTNIPARRDTVRAANGTFAITFEATDKNEVTTKMTFTRPRFISYDTTITYSATNNTLKLGTIVLHAIDPNEDNIITGVPSLKPVSIVFVGSSVNALSINGSGGVDVASLTFEGRDSLGVPVDLAHQLNMHFRFVSRPDPLTGFNRDTIGTNASGRSTVLLTAGQRAGIVQVQAFGLTTTSTGAPDTIKSPIVSLPIYGGAADSTHFTIGTTKYNVPGAVKFNLRAPITAIVGDKFGNPAQPGTVVYFTTTGGVIQSSASSSPDGLVTVDLITGNPIPPNGIATITAQIASGSASGKISPSAGTGVNGLMMAKTTAVLSDATIPQPLNSYVASSVRGTDPVKTKSIFSRSVNILLSGASTIRTADTNFVITTGSEKKINFFVGDANGNPLSEGTTIKVTGAGLDTSGVALSGDVDKLIPDTQDKAYTQYSILLSDKRTTNLNIAKKVAVTIEVNSVNGNTKLTLSGTLPPVGSDSGKAGIPDTSHFTVFTDKANYPWYGPSGQPIGNVVVQLGDMFGHPIVLTPVYFSTNAGRVTSMVQTDVNGRAQASLLGGLPVPSNGIGTITVSVAGSGSTTLTKNVSFFYTGSPILSFPGLVKDTLSSIVDGSFTDVIFEIKDNNGNPVAPGNAVKVSVIGSGAPDITLSQDINTSTDGVRTRYSFRASDANPGAGKDGDLIFTISVDGVTGTTTKVLYGKILGSNNIIVPPSVRQPAQIAFIGASASDISVSGVGGLENAVITYEVRDSLGQPIDKSKRTFATYTLQFFPNSTVGGGTPPRVIPGSDSTNDQGRLLASISSGSQAGTIQLVANIAVNGNFIKSQPVKLTVHGGFPDQAHFSLLPAVYTILWGDIATTPKFTVAVGDTFSNPVAAGTAIYMHSQAGVIVTGKDNFNAYTDASGFASVSFSMVNPHPDVLPYYYVPPTGSFYDPLINGRQGYFWVYAQTQGRFNKQVIDSVLMLESLLPASIAGIPATVVGFPIGGQSAPINIQILDVRGNPLPAGTVIDVTVDYPITADGTVKFGITGDNHSVIPNDGGARFRGRGVTDFSFSIVDQTVGGSSPTQSVIVNVVVKVDATHQYQRSFSAKVQ
jgi:hypothetical protein